MIIPLFLPQQGCPGQCIYCNQPAVTGKGKSLPSSAEIRATVENYLNTTKSKSMSVELAFFGGSFSNLPISDQRRLLTEAQIHLQQGRVQGIRLSCRPDSITDELLHLYQHFSVKTVEIGAQSQHADVLRASGRQHDPADTIKAIRLLKRANFVVGVHLMTGLPQDTPEKSLASLTEILWAKPDFLRIHPTLVLQGSPLAVAYLQGNYHPWSLGKTTALLAKMGLMAAAAEVRVVRWGMMPGEMLEECFLAGPYHPALGELVRRCQAYHYLLALLAKVNPKQSKHEVDDHYLTINVPQRDLSLLTGVNRWLLRRMEALTGLRLAVAVRDEQKQGIDKGNLISENEKQGNLLTDSLPFAGNWFLSCSETTFLPRDILLQQEEFISNYRIY